MTTMDKICNDINNFKLSDLEKGMVRVRPLLEDIVADADDTYLLKEEVARVLIGFGHAEVVKE